MGGLTVWFNDPHFIKMKPTIIYVAFAAILGFGLLQGKSYLRLVMGDVLPMLRIALAGTMQGPAVFDMAALLGKEEVLERLTIAYNYFDKTVLNQ